MAAAVNSPTMRASQSPATNPAKDTDERLKRHLAELAAAHITLDNVPYPNDAAVLTDDMVLLKAADPAPAVQDAPPAQAQALPPHALPDSPPDQRLADVAQRGYQDERTQAETDSATGTTPANRQWPAARTTGGGPHSLDLRV